jgi:hypothetical protein
MFKKILSGIWNFSLKKGWNWIWSKTEIDEKAIEVVEETKRRAKRVKEEMADVATELKEVKEQAKDVVAAAKGAKRRGRPKKKQA